MIKSFADKETAKVAAGEISKKLPRDIQEPARDKLRILDATVKIESLWAMPSLNAEKLRGAGVDNAWSIRINKQWRIVSLWDAATSSADNVRIADYH